MFWYLSVNSDFSIFSALFKNFYSITVSVRSTFGLNLLLLLFAFTWLVSKWIGHIDIGIIFYCIGNSQWCICNTQSKSDWLFNTQSRILQADWLTFENNEKATLNTNMLYSTALWYWCDLVLKCKYCKSNLLRLAKFFS